MQCAVFMFTAYKGVVLRPRVSASDPNRCVGVDSLGAGQCQKFPGKHLAPTESSEEPKNHFDRSPEQKTPLIKITVSQPIGIKPEDPCTHDSGREICPCKTHGPVELTPKIHFQRSVEQRKVMVGRRMPSEPSTEERSGIVRTQIF